jgi:DNA-binding CsgD family transcriptional regulator
MPSAVSAASRNYITPSLQPPRPRHASERPDAWSAAVTEGMETLLGRVLESLDHGLLVCDLHGDVLLQTPALTRALDAEPEQGRLRAAINKVVRGLGKLARSAHAATTDSRTAPITTHDIRTASARYRLRGSLLSPGRNGTESDTAVVIVLERTEEPAALSSDVLRTRFRLTAREQGVAKLLAEGKGNAEIARALRISPHTARRHTESVMLKLAVRSRAAVGARLRGG